MIDECNQLTFDGVPGCYVPCVVNCRLNFFQEVNDEGQQFFNSCECETSLCVTHRNTTAPHDVDCTDSQENMEFLNYLSDGCGVCSTCLAAGCSFCDRTYSAGIYEYDPAEYPISFCWDGVGDDALYGACDKNLGEATLRK